ncbi:MULTISPECIES: hypothetical protein [unclassified Arthrobacter]|uniref:hypothetical protein n=1 Tax=unclassified Arthrobacter TaxID=235627 RepID=UPI00159D1731|nr:MULTISPECIES: hypothetical protein [unclassified Arthrobacter]MCQ9164510.1 hypothetical protein [Arthrobacter sp. STN4]NVM98237.1 hypothetical protein [Arthrobacter sp. SDTb3-6]
MQDFWHFVGNFWWLAFPLAGIVGGWGRAVSKASDRRHERRMEMYRLKHPEAAALPPLPQVTLAKDPEAFTEADVAKVMDAHDAVNRRWLDYELDVGKLIDFPMMTDVREPLTVAFLRAKRDADALRPVAAAEVTAKTRWDDYRNAVNAYDVAFDVAEKEARRIKDTAYSEPERQRLGTARKLVNLAENEAASPAERQSAFKRARKELDGIIVLPDVTLAALEQKVARMINRSN